MLHFIPAWYQQNTWSENEQNWYVRRKRTEFDDTVNRFNSFIEVRRILLRLCFLVLLRISDIFYIDKACIMHRIGPVLTQCRR